MADDSSRTIVHRVVFYDLLSHPGREIEMKPHLSIPLAPGLESVWAPNGYGKTFAMKLLEKIRFPSSESDERLGAPQYWLGRFLKEARSEVIEPSDQQTRSSFSSMNPIDADLLSGIRSWRDGEIPKMVPFSKMMIRFVTLDETDTLTNVEDLWVDAEAWLRGKDETCYLTLFDYGGICIHETPEILTDPGVPMDRELFHMINSFAEIFGMDVSSMNEAYQNRFAESEEYSFMPSVIPEPFQNLWGWNHEDGKFYPIDCPAYSLKGSDQIRVSRIEPMNPEDFFVLISDTQSPEDTEMFSLTREWALLDIMSQMRVKYVEIPKECHGSESDPLQKCQDLISSMIELAFSNDDTIDEVAKNIEVIESIIHVDPEDRFNAQHDFLDRKSYEDNMHETYFFEDNYEEGQEIISDSDVQTALDSEEGELKAMAKSRTIILDIVQSVFDRINDSIMTNEDDPWARKVSSWRHRSTKQLRRSPMRFERPKFRDYVDPNTLSFGQRSAIVLECWLGYMALMEFTSQPSALHGSGHATSPRTCLVIDEPEAGRSEHSVDSLSYRVSEARGLVGSVSDNSLLVMSHRRDVLEAVGDGGRFHLMQQFDDAELANDSEE